jgi:hypothetical protein
VKLPKRFRLIGHCRCGDERHRVGLTRDGRLVPLDHTPSELRRWEAFAQLGGVPPLCLTLCKDSDVEKWDLPRLRRSPEHDLFPLIVTVGRVIRLRAERASARDLPGQGKRNRRLAKLAETPGKEVRTFSVKRPRYEDGPFMRFLMRYGDYRHDRILSHYRRHVIGLKIMREEGYCPPKRRKRRVYFDYPDSPPGQRTR